MNKIALHLRTARHLRPSQILYWLLRRKLDLRRNIRSAPTDPVREGVRLGDIIRPSRETLDENTFCFLNQARRFDLNHMDWECTGMPKLWRYNLHYFDYILASGTSDETADQLINSWIDRNPQGKDDAWEPYTVSLRIVNWIKYFLLDRQNRVDGKWVNSLFEQAHWLSFNMENHILANHYIKNGLALLYSGFFFGGEHSKEWWRKGLDILVEQGEEQFLSDGGHYERSFMYHSIVVEDFLDALNLLQSSPGVTGSDVTERIRLTAIRGLQFLDDLLYPDGEIALFNDAAFSIAPSPGRLLDYGSRLAGYSRAERDDLELIRKEDCGYYGYRTPDEMLLIDCGPIGPDYQPGHAHCDTLSYELFIDGQRLIVDSGVHDYEVGEMRDYVRSTAAHNTVRVDEVEQSEVWGAFRVARRAYPREADIHVEAGQIVFSGAHDGYQRLQGRVLHHRTITCKRGGPWVFEDRLLGRGNHLVESFIHIHPDFEVEGRDSEFHVRNKEGRTIALIDIQSPCDVDLEQGNYCPEFGVKTPNRVLVLRRSTELPATLMYRVRKPEI